MIAWERKKVRRGNAANFMSGLCGYRFGHPDAVHGGAGDTSGIPCPASPWGMPHGGPKGI